MSGSQVSAHGVLYWTVTVCHIDSGGSLTVWAAADRGVLWTGVRRWLRLSHRTICPEYVPPTNRLGWNLAKPTDTTGDWGNRQREEERMRQQKHHAYYSGVRLFCGKSYIKDRISWIDGATWWQLECFSPMRCGDKTADSEKEHKQWKIWSENGNARRSVSENEWSRRRDGWQLRGDRQRGRWWVWLRWGSAEERREGWR